MLLGFVGLGAVVETAYLPALHNLYGDSLHCLGFDVQPGRHPEGVTRCASLTELLSHPLDTLFITTASLQHLEVLEHALASPVVRIVVEKTHRRHARAARKTEQAAGVARCGVSCART